MSLSISEDLPTARLGIYLAIGFTVQLVTGLLGIGLGHAGAMRVAWVHPILIALAVALACGVRQARTILLIVTWMFLLLASFVFVVALTALSPLGMVLSGGLVALAAVQMVALAFTVPDAGLASGVPERWRRWATSDWLHLVILLSGLLAAFSST
ncbi:MAG TPA: hypothetical protein VFJ85_10420 [Acidimicrobiales bacterium]|nr:hypothetical protein [Acidimicrobiales bacterium]